MKIIPLIPLAVACYSTYGQQLPDSTASAYKPAAAIQQDYYKDKISLTKLYNGSEYIDYTKLYNFVEGHQFFLSTEKSIGNVTYDNHLFEEIILAYDIARNQVIVQHANNPFTLKLISKNIQNFTIGGHYFKRIEADSSNNASIKTGFYELLSDNSFKVFAQRKKVTHEKIDQRKIILEFTSEDKLYIAKSNTFYEINSKKSLIRALDSKETETKKYIKTNKLKFDIKHRETSVLSTIKYFENLL
jgi:hypothetical protein